MLQTGDAVLLPVGHDSIVFEWEGRHHRCRPDRLTPRQRTLIEVFRHPDKRQDAPCGPLKYDYREVDLPDRDAAKRWIYRHADGQRNMTPEKKSYLRGVRQ